MTTVPTTFGIVCRDPESAVLVGFLLTEASCFGPLDANTLPLLSPELEEVGSLFPERFLIYKMVDSDLPGHLFVGEVAPEQRVAFASAFAMWQDVRIGQDAVSRLFTKMCSHCVRSENPNDDDKRPLSLRLDN